MPAFVPSTWSSGFREPNTGCRGALFLTVVLPGCDARSIRRPLRRSDQHPAAIAEYKTAVVLPSEIDNENGNRGWNHPLPADSPVRAKGTGRAHTDIIKVNYTPTQDDAAVSEHHR